ncbi:MAG: isoprenylcysteine carboxylmethyltransferase family protein [Actinomycetia bacterium]|nr:isoprenylcysteine carboxylmethyltransferase family protein [Actinomycetes bacterium]
MTGWLWVGAVGAYLVLAGFFVLERFVRVAGARDMRRGDTDRGSTTFVSVAMAVAFVIIPLTPLLNWWGCGRIGSPVAGAIGVVLGIVGLVVRYRAFTTLGRFFTRTLQETDQHRLVTDGVYRRIRHPGYLSDMLIFWGAALAMGNWITLTVVVVLFVPAYAYRIRTEEALLTDIFGRAYRDYQHRSARLIPGLW